MLEVVIEEIIVSPPPVHFGELAFFTVCSWGVMTHHSMVSEDAPFDLGHHLRLTLEKLLHPLFFFEILFFY